MKRILIFLFAFLSFFASRSQINLVGYIQTNGVANYPTHIDSMGKGGYVVVKNINQRDSITCLRRKYGMAVYVQNLNKLYILKDTLCVNTWQEFTGGTGDLQSVTDIGDTTTNSIRIGDTLTLKPSTSPYTNSLVTVNPAFEQGSNKYFYFPAISGSTATLVTSAQAIDSLKRSSDSVYARKNTQWLFQFKDSTGGDTATVVKAFVTNAEATTLQRGEVVYIFGASGDRASVKRANNKSDTTSSKTFAVVRDSIVSGQQGWVVTQGQCGKLNLGSPYVEGDILYLDSISGKFTRVKPLAPLHLVFLGVVERSNSGNGIIYVKPQNGYELGELHNVNVNGQADNDVLYYQSSTQLWKAKSAYQLVDTTNLSTRIDARVKYTDTSTMLSKYVRSFDANLTYQKQVDTIPLFVFGAGSGANSDTSAFTTSAIYGSFYNDYSDTIIVTAIRIGLRGTSPSINAIIYVNDSLGTTAGATQVISGGTTATNIHGGTVATSITNNKIAPGNWVWVQTNTLTTKPTYFILTLFGYRKPR